MDRVFSFTYFNLINLPIQGGYINSVYSLNIYYSPIKVSVDMCAPKSFYISKKVLICKIIRLQSNFLCDDQLKYVEGTSLLDCR